MITKEKQVITEEKEIITNILCNQCSESLYNGMNYNGLVEIQVAGGYDSKYLVDGTTYKFSLCEKCLSEMFNKFKHEPDIF